MRKVIAIMTMCITLGAATMTVEASSLEDVIGNTEAVSNEETTVVEEEETPDVDDNTPVEDSTPVESTDGETDDFIQSMHDATELSAASPAANKVNQTIKKVASFIVRILAYFITAFLVVRVLLDLCYICLPFTRSFLANGYGGNPQAGGSAGVGMGAPGMGMGMGMGAPGMGMGMGMGGFGGTRYGMGMGNGMANNMMQMQGAQQGSAPGAAPSLGRVQWISTPALNAVAAESVVGTNGKPMSALKVYAKEMIVILVVTPILLTLAITGVLTDVGFLIGDLIARMVSNMGNSI